MAVYGMGSPLLLLMEVATQMDHLVDDDLFQALPRLLRRIR